MASILVRQYFYIGGVWKYRWLHFDFENDYYWLCDEAKLPYDFTYQPRISEEYTDDVYIGSYVKGQEEPLTLPGLLFDPEYAEDGEVLADSMFVELKKNRG